MGNLTNTNEHKINLTILEKELEKFPELSQRHLIAILQTTQDAYGYLPIPALEYISDRLEMPLAKVFGVTTFYSQFRLEPLGKHVIQVCNGTACNVRGSEPLMDELITILGIEPGETTPDGMFTFLQVACVGACGIAPAVVIDGTMHGRLTPRSLQKLVNSIIAADKKAAEAGDGEAEAGAGAGAAADQGDQTDQAAAITFLDRHPELRDTTTVDRPAPDFVLSALNPDHQSATPDICATYREELSHLANHTSPQFISHISLCKGLTCDASGEPGILAAFEKELAARGILDKVEFIETGCQGLCEVGPIVQIQPLEAFYCRVKAADVPEIVEKHILGGERVERLFFAPDCPTEDTIPFYKTQERRVLSNTGKINPENIDEYIAQDGYKALYKALAGPMAPEDIIKTVTASGLRGRGGGGFPTGRKWQIIAATEDKERYVVCNADEGDPGAFMDRSVLEGDPHRVLEGMILAGYAIGASKGFIYCRAEYPLAIDRLYTAMNQAREYGLLGKNILGTGYDLDMEIIQGAGAFVCGEETAMLSSIEGKRGTARNKPPYPAVSGFNGHPTCVNNVETFANIPLIIDKGVEWFRSTGTETSPGTKIFSISGKVNNTGLVEVPMGISVKELIMDIGGGVAGDTTLKAAQSGGPSGGCIPADLMDTPIDYESLTALGSIMGSGGLVVTDAGTCMVAFARFFLSFTQHESCGKCIPCREGTKRMLEILDRIVQGEGKLEDMDELKSLSRVIQRTSACGLGLSSPNPVVSTLKYFEDEYISHIVDQKCKAGVCKPLIRFHILDNCKSCGLCARHCPVDCISGQRGEIYVIDQERCTKCARCQEVCPFGAVARN